MSLPPTEGINPRTRAIDTLDARGIVDLLAREQILAGQVVAGAGAAIAQAVEAIVARLRAGGSLHYVGAGTSGRLGALDAAECPPTFGTLPSLVVAHIAGGPAALLRAVEGAEDDAAAGEAELRASGVGAGDAVVGISASGGAPYVIGALLAAHEAGALTIAIASSADSPLARWADIAIALDTGAEPISGSTRLKAGTAAKLALNAISTTTMIRLGKVYGNLMVDVVASNAKLRARAIRLVRELTRVDEERAKSLLHAAGGSVKVAIVMACREVDVGQARALLAQHDGFLRAVID